MPSQAPFSASIHAPARLRRLLVLMLGVALIGGCGLFGPGPDRQVARTVPDYPEQAPVARELDIIVVRDGSAIRLINRTPRRYHHVALWLNQQYVDDIDQIEIGVNEPIPLRRFHNGFGESFPTGSFLRPERSARLVLAEFLDQDGALHKLTVQPPGTR